LFNPVQILLKTAVKLEKGGDKTENRILVLTPYRLFLLTAKVPTKIDGHSEHLSGGSAGPCYTQGQSEIVLFSAVMVKFAWRRYFFQCSGSKDLGL
jgi:hypothetical protein